MLSDAERLDLRKRVLAGEDLSLDEARAVFETLRQNQGGAVLAAEDKKRKGGRKSNPGITDEKLDSDLADLGL